MCGIFSTHPETARKIAKLAADQGSWRAVRHLRRTTAIIDGVQISCLPQDIRAAQMGEIHLASTLRFSRYQAEDAMSCSAARTNVLFSLSRLAL